MGTKDPTSEVTPKWMILSSLLVNKKGKVTMVGMKSYLDDLCDSTFTSMFCCLPDAKMASRHKGP